VTISSYQIDTVLRVYTRQNNAKTAPSGARKGTGDAYQDKVTLGGNGGRNDALEKISYSLVDILLSAGNKQ